MTHRKLRIGVASYEDMKARSMAIARGELRPGKDDPVVWFTSLDSFAKVLSSRNQALLDMIVKNRPGSLTELEALSGRAKSNLSRTLKTMARYGLVELRSGENGRIVPHVPYDQIVLNMPVTAGARSAA